MQNFIIQLPFFGGFPLADVPDAGSNKIVVADANKVIAEQKSREIAEMAWKQRADLVYHRGSLPDT